VPTAFSIRQCARYDFDDPRRRADTARILMAQGAVAASRKPVAEGRWARPATRDPSGVIYKIEHGDHGTLAHCRIFGGELRVRDRAGDRRDLITSLERSTPQGWVRDSVVRAGDVARIRGISAARTGSWVGETVPGRVTRQFPAPALESVVAPVDPAMRGRLFAALRELADADPLINLRVDEEHGEIAVSLYGEVQKEVIADLLDEQFGVAVAFRPTVTVHIERITGTGASFDLMPEKTTPYLATLGFRVEPVPAGQGLVCGLRLRNANSESNRRHTFFVGTSKR
jgi:ribosomal protection tetracycline resistance protein